MHRLKILIIALIASFNLNAAQPNWDAYDGLLNKYISKKTVRGISLNYLDYQGVFKDPRFASTIAEIEKFPTASLNSKEEKLTFYINAYNIFAIKVVRDNWPLESIKDAGSWISPVWKKTAGTLNGKDISLDEIEHKILRPLGEPRVHFAIVCASLSCPDLRPEAFKVGALDAQLEDQTKKFLSNPSKGLKVSGNTAKISKIFDWFEDDFEVQGGVLKFINKHLPNESFNKVDAAIPYNWLLNGS